MSSASEPTNQNQILFVLFLGVLMGALDASIVGPAFPAVGGEFKIDSRILVWTFNLYLLAYLIGTPFMAKLSDRNGRKPIYLLNIILFAVGSLITALSPSYEILLLGRVIQGFGAGGIFPVASAFIGDTISPEKRGRAFGTIGSVFGIAFIFGPIIAGVLLNFGWRWLFLINMPIAFILIIMSLLYLPRTGTKQVKPFDYWGMLVLATALSLIAYSLNSLDASNLIFCLMNSLSLPLLLIGFLLILPLYYIEKGADDPIIKLNLFHSQQFFTAMCIALGIGLAQAALVFVPSYTFLAFNLGLSLASFSLIPLVVSTVIGAPLFGIILDRKGSKIVVITATIILTIGFLIFVLTNNLTIFLFSGLLVGLGFSGILGAPLRYIVLNESSPAERATAQGILSVHTSFGQIVGGALLGGIISSFSGQIGGYKFSYLFLVIIGLVMFFLALNLKGRTEEIKEIDNNL